MIKVTCISDTHGLHGNIYLEQTDILLFSGDSMTCGYKLSELLDFLTWFESQPAKYKVMIAGNHDRFIEDNPTEFRKILKDYPSITYLEDESITIEGINIYGTPHSKEFYDWAFNRTEEQLRVLFGKVPLNTHILLSHAPPLGFMDELIDGRNVGELNLSKKIPQLDNLELHVFGHIHNFFGMLKPHGKHISVNASQVDEFYKLKNFPVVIPLKNLKFS